MLGGSACREETEGDHQPYRGILIRLIIWTFLLELRSGLRLKRRAPNTGGESPLAEDPRSPPLSAGYPRFSSHRGDLRFRIWRQRPEGPVQALWPRHCAARMSDPGPLGPYSVLRGVSGERGRGVANPASGSSHRSSGQFAQAPLTGLTCPSLSYQSLC